MNTLKTKLNQHGFSLIEIMVAVGIGAIVMYGLSDAITMMLGTQKRISLKDSVLSNNGIIHTTLANADLCANAMVINGQTPTFPPQAIGTLTAGDLPRVIPINSLQIFRAGGTALPIVTAGAENPRGVLAQTVILTVTNFLGPVPGQPLQSQFAATLSIAYKFTMGSGTYSFQQEQFPLLLTANNAGTGVLLACSGSAVGLTEADVCRDSFNGTFTAGATPNCSSLGQNVTVGNAATGLSVAAGGTHITGISNFANDLNLGSNLNVVGGGTFNGSIIGTVITGTTLSGTSINVSGQVSGASANFTGAMTSGSVSTGPASLTSANISGQITAGSGNLTTLNVANNMSVTNAITVTTLHGSGNSDGFNQMSAISFVTPSDRSLKENMTPIAAQTDSINKILIYNYNYKSDKDKIVHAGVVAQEIQNIYPHLVNKTKDGHLAVNYNELVPYLIKGLQEANQRIDALQKKLDTYEKAAHVK